MSFPVLTNLDLNGNQLLNAGLQQLASDPGSPFEGQIWQNTTSDEVKAYLNGTITVLQSGPITSADIADDSIVNADINSGAAIAKSKLANLDVVNADVNASAAIAESKLNLATDAAAGTGSRRTLGTGATQAMPGNTRLDTITAPTGSVALNAQKITGLADGTAATDAVTKQQLDGAILGMDTKSSVKAASTATVGTVSGATLTAAPNTLDGVTLAANDRILVKDHSTPAANGIYTVTTLGSGANGVWTRATDFDAWTEIPGSIVAVEQGSVNADRVYLSTADQGGTIGSTAVTFSHMNPVAAGGLAKFSQDITGNASATQFTVTHNLGTTDVHVAVYDVSNDLLVITDVKRPTTNTCRIDFAIAPANLKVYRVVVMG